MLKKLVCPHCSIEHKANLTEEELDEGADFKCNNCGEDFHILRRTCPYCKEIIKQGAIKCKHCGEILVKQNTTSPWSSFFGIIGWIVFVVLIYLWWTGSFSSDSPDGVDSYEDVVKKVEKSIVYITYDVTALNEMNKFVELKASGSGIVRESSNAEIKILTNRHVVDCLFDESCSSKYDEEISVRTNGGTIYNKIKEIKFAQHNIDLAVLTLSKKSEDFLPAIISTNSIPNVGDKVIAIGYPGFTKNVVEFSRSKGKITAYRDFLTADGFAFKGIESDAFADFGSSGGGLFSEAGGLIGMVTWKLGSQKLMAVDITTINDLKIVACEEGSYLDLDGKCVLYCNLEEYEALGADNRCYKPCKDFYCKTIPPSPREHPSCPSDMIPGNDGYCHQPCESAETYCTSKNAICYMNQCSSCSGDKNLYEDGVCR